MIKYLLVILFVIVTSTLLGCGDSNKAPVSDSIAANEDESDMDEREQAKRFAEADEREHEYIRKKENAEKELQLQQDRQQLLKEQRERETLCSKLFGDLNMNIKVTPSASVKKMLGNDYTVELRGVRGGIDPKEFIKAISTQNWLKVLSIIKKENITEYPYETDTDNIRAEFLNHDFLVLIKTKVDMKRTIAISLTEGMPIDLTDNYSNDTENNTLRSYIGFHIYVDGKPLRCCKGVAGGWIDPFTKLERHPDDTGWYFTWRPIDGEIIIMPDLVDILHRELNDFDKLQDDRVLKSLEKYGPVLTGYVAKMKKTIADVPVENQKQSFYGDIRHREHMRDTEKSSPWLIINELKEIGPILVGGAMQDEGILPTLKIKYKLGELTPRQIIDTLQKTFMERYRLRREAALAL